MKNNVLVVGTGEGVNSVDLWSFLDKYPGIEILAFQEAFEHMELTPDIWTWSDPNSAIKGLKRLLKTNTEGSIPVIYLPDFMTHDYATFRMYCGSTPLGKSPELWREYTNLLSQVDGSFKNLRVIVATTTKYLSQNPFSAKDLKGKDWFGTDANLRFEHNRPIFGSVPYDDERVIGTKNVWGLENKLSYYVLPLIHRLGYTDAYVCGFGMKGGRFFDINKTRMPFNDENQSSSQHEIPLDMIRKWTDDWKPFHKMNLYSIESDEHTYLNDIMEMK